MKPKIFIIFAPLKHSTIQRLYPYFIIKAKRMLAYSVAIRP